MSKPKIEKLIITLRRTWYVIYTAITFYVAIFTVGDYVMSGVLKWTRRDHDERSLKQVIGDYYWNYFEKYEPGGDMFMSTALVIQLVVLLIAWIAYGYPPTNG